MKRDIELRTMVSVMVKIMTHMMMNILLMAIVTGAIMTKIGVDLMAGQSFGIRS